MDHLSVPSRANSAKAKALEAGREMQDRIIEAANRENRTPPKYVLIELIGRGSFGLVYKGKNVTTADIVAVKIIDIDESDLANPRYSDTYNEFLKEVGALKQLRETKACNINHVIDALAVGTTLWLITEYCGGGSVATLMKPTAPGGLDEKWIIPILRETAKAIKWVHGAGIIHRDVKCANILVTEEGDVKLCDFGVAATVESNLQKRSTFTGTPHWMAPELFGSNRSYGKEVDIWAFGAMIHEIATGLPPNVQNGISYLSLGSHLRSNAPTLEGSNLSTELQSLAACCLETRPDRRPSIEKILQHPYLYNSEHVYPTSSLSGLVKQYDIWERRGNGRQSLITSSEPPGQVQRKTSEEWIFTTTTTAFNQKLAPNIFEETLSKPKNAKLKVMIPPHSGSLKHSPVTAPSHNTSCPNSLSAIQSPLEQAFDPKIMSNYEENSQRYYSPSPQSPKFGSVIPSQETQLSSQDSHIDLGYFDTGAVLESTLEGLGINLNLDQQSILPGERYTYNVFSINDQTMVPRIENDPNKYRCSNDWKLPPSQEEFEMEPSVSPSEEDIFRPLSTTLSPSSGRLALKYYPTDPTSMRLRSDDDWISDRESLIDLSIAMPVMPPPFSAILNHGAGFADSNVPPQLKSAIQEHSRELLPDLDFHLKPSGTQFQTSPELPQVAHGTLPHTPMNEHPRFSYDASLKSLYSQDFSQRLQSAYVFPDLPDPPSNDALLGQLSPHETAKEVSRMFEGLQEQLMTFQSVYHSVAEVIKKKEAEKSDGVKE